MKNSLLINSSISRVIADLGHTDLICIGDAGLPVPKNIEKIDLALKLGLPSFIETLSVISNEAYFEEVIFSKDIMEHFPKLVDDVKNILGNIKITLIEHSDFKNMLPDTKAIIRTGENKWFHNVILKSGVTF